MFYDAESRTMLARERNELLHAGFSEGEQRVRRWLSKSLIAAGEKVAPGKCAGMPERSTTRTRAAY